MSYPDHILYQVSKPARYTGGEWNSIVKDWDKTPVRVALIYPDLYEIGMSNMALPILYELLNSQPDVLAERAFAPWTDMEAVMRSANIPLPSLESRHPLKDFDIIGRMPVKSLITYPKSGVEHKLGKPFALRGHAWAGDLAVDKVHVSIDFGATWHKAELKSPVNRFAWQRFNAEVDFPGPGYYEVWARATDTASSAQPMVLPGWNPKGYLNNACHRIAVQVA